VLKVSHLECTRSERTLFSNLTFKVEQGQWIWVRGSNGAGKTSLLKVLAGLIPQDRGDIYWNNIKILPYVEQYIQDLSYLAHAPALHPLLTPIENLSWLMNLSNMTDITAPCIAALDFMGLTEIMNTPIEALSYGQKQRVAISTLLLRTTKLWILDEPSTGLDIDGQKLLAKLLQKHLSTGGMAVIASHSSFDDLSKPNLILNLSNEEF
jgi:heme exporter protein A